MTRFILIVLALILPVINFSAQTADVSPKSADIPAMDEFTAGKSKIKIYFIGHGSLRIDIDKKVIQIDPVKRYTDYSKQPKADYILITHEHSDHFEADTIGLLSKASTKIILNQSVFDKFKKGNVLKNGQIYEDKILKIEAVPAYNTTPDRNKFHPKDRDNGYILSLGDKRIYIAGDTEEIPEMANFKNIDIAFLPINQPYTMTPEQAAKAADAIKPKILYPYHFGDTDLTLLKNLMSEKKDIDLRIRNLK